MGNARGWLREFSSIAAAGMMWAFQIAFAAAGKVVPGPWDRLVGCVTLSFTIWAMLSLRDRQKAWRPGQRVMDEEAVETLLAAFARGYEAGQADRPDARQLRPVPSQRLGA